MANFGTMRARVCGFTQGHLLESQVELVINRCHQEELEANPWARRRTNTVLNTTAPYSTGTVSVAQGSTALTGVGTAFTAGMVGLQIRPSGQQVALTIGAVGGAGALTLSTAWPSTSIVNQPFVIFRQRYSITGADEVINVTNNTPLRKKTIEEINLADPGRFSSANPPTFWAPAGRDSNDYAQFELWPWASAAIPITVEYLIAHTEMHAATDRPLVPGNVVENKALRDCCRMIFALNGDQRWLNLGMTYEQTYQDELLKALEQDKTQYGTLEQVLDLAGAGMPGADLIWNHDI